MTRRICLLIALAVLAPTSCTRAPFPSAPLEKVTTFSAGSARGKSLGKNPNARQVYDATLALYDSVESMALSCDVTDRQVHGWSTVGGRATDTEEDIEKTHTEYRYKRPDKEMAKSTGDLPVVVLRNGGRCFTYMPKDNVYVEWLVKPTVGHSLASNWLNLLPDERRLKFSAIELLDDTTMDGASVYVLELRLPYKKTSTGYMPPQVRRLYLGKTDLLPRKIEVFDEPTKEEKKQRVPASGETYVFSGVSCNTVLSPGVLPAKPPAGAKPMKMR